jgi:hypothetical protein
MKLDMNDIRDIIMTWEKGFDTQEEEMFYYLKHSETLAEYIDFMPKGGAIREHPWDRYDD